MYADDTIFIYASTNPYGGSNEFLHKGGIEPSKRNPTCDQHMAVRSFQRTSDAICKQQWWPQLK